MVSSISHLLAFFQTKICDSSKCRLLKILPRVLSDEKKMTAKDYFALHSDIPNVLKKIYLLRNIFSVLFFIYVYIYYIYI